MPRDLCGDSEHILRAITSDDIAQQPDGTLFIKPTSFEGATVSVSRLSVLSLEEIFKIFLHDVQKTNRQPPRFLKCGVELEVGTLKEVCLNYQERPTEIQVQIDPIIPDNPAHAEIVVTNQNGKISKGLSRIIVAFIERHRLIRNLPDAN
ncbi:MAG: hypothetical protein SNJ55_08740 [Chloroherpetonaceae bacterium]